jgi:nicotinamidase-related amidase
MGDFLVDPVPPSAVHLCVDMQRIFSSDGPWPTPWMERVLPTVTRIAERFPESTVFNPLLSANPRARPRLDR